MRMEIFDDRRRRFVREGSKTRVKDQIYLIQTSKYSTKKSK